MRKYVSWDKDTLIGEGKRQKMKQKKSLTISHKQTNAHPVSKQQPPSKPEVSLPCSSTLVFTAEHDIMVWKSLLANWGQLSQLCPLPISCPPQPTCWRKRVRKRESLDTVQALFNNSKNFGGLATNWKHDAIWATMKKVNSIPARPSAVSKSFRSSLCQFSIAWRVLKMSSQAWEGTKCRLKN